MLLIILCVTFLPFAFASINTTCLPSEEVEALKKIGIKLGKSDWDFTLDPCLGWDVSITATGDNILTCSFEKNCHVVSIILRGQNLNGTLPPEFINLRYLQILTLSRNYLNGTIPTEWGFMERIKTISLLANRLTGPIPRELGNISTLRSLTVEDNMMSGAIPDELGMLTGIGRLFLSSNFFTGKLPASFAKLINMKAFRISGNNLSGKIPDFIGEWTNLTGLRIQGSGLEGPIPSSVTLLESLTDLRISDLEGPDTTFPPFSSNTTHLKTLILRSCNLIGQLPVLPRSLASSLRLLDLSFNKLNGSIPESSSDLMNVDYIYLTRNSLSGRVPQWMIAAADNVDLSYNNFTIDNATDYRCQMRQTNLFASFSMGNSFRKVSCSRNSFCPTNSSRSTTLYINCGGERLRVGDKEYESDLEPGGASYFSEVDSRWGFSNTGNFLDDDIRDTYSVTQEPCGVQMDASGLYRNARMSAISLNYYGFCMVAGSYNVTLHFAEIVFTDDTTFSSLGRRVFDIYIQVSSHG